MIVNTNPTPRFEITRNLSNPREAMVFLNEDDPLALTLALDKLIDPNGDYRDVETAKIYDRRSDRPASGSYVFTGVIVLEYGGPEFLNNFPKQDLTMRLFAPDGVRQDIAARFVEKTGIPGQDVFISPSMTLVRNYYHNHRVRSDFAQQAAHFFADGTLDSLMPLYGEQVFPKREFAFPMYAMILSARLTVREEVNLDTVRAFLLSAQKDIFRSDNILGEPTRASLLQDLELLNDDLLSKCLIRADHVLSRDELPPVYSRCIAGYRKVELEIDPETILNRINGNS